MAGLSRPVFPATWGPTEVAHENSTAIARTRVDIDCVDLGATRKRAVVTARRLGVDLQRLHDVELAVAELLSNACEHGTAPTLRMAQVAGRLTIDVRNQAPQGAIPPVVDWKLPPPTATNGRGLAIIAAVADDVTVRWIDVSPLPVVSVRISFPLAR